MFNILQIIEGHSVGRDHLNVSLENSLVVPRAAQPLYANAPPKPRRLNTSHDPSDSSPEPSTETSSSLKIGGSITPLLFNGTNTPLIYNGQKQEASLSGRHSSINNLVHTSERRTPDVYGASVYSKTDYEEIYDDSEIIAGLQSPKYPVDKIIGTRDSYASTKSNVTRISDEFVTIDLSKSGNRKQASVPRPHSADFLEYDRTKMSSEITVVKDNGSVQPNRIRSQSSMGHEVDYWSEENYAQKMRQSSLYQSKNMSKSPYNFRGGVPAVMGPRVPPAGAATPDLYANVPVQQRAVPTIGEVPSSAHHFNALKFSDRLNTSNSDSHTTDTLVAVDKLNTSTSSSNTVHTTTELLPSFSRSASARLPRGRRKDDSFDSSLADDTDDPDNKKVYQVNRFSF